MHYPSLVFIKKKEPEAEVTGGRAKHPFELLNYTPQ